MAAFTAALLAANAAAGYFGTRRQADAAVQQGNYEGDLLDRNAGVADAQAADALARGRESEQQYRGGVRRTIGAQRAATAASGVDIEGGSAEDVRADTATIGELDALTIRNNAAREAYGFQVQASNDRSRAGLARRGGQNAASAARAQGVSTLLTAGAQLYGMGSESGLFKRGGGGSTVPVGTRVDYTRRSS